jgi:hypothetical protein
MTSSVVMVPTSLLLLSPPDNIFVIYNNKIMPFGLYLEQFGQKYVIVSKTIQERTITDVIDIEAVTVTVISFTPSPQ